MAEEVSAASGARTAEVAELTDGSHASARTLPAGRLWFGLRCSAFDGGRRELAVFVDGAEVQRIDTQCPAAAARDRPPDAQFTIVSESGVRAVRLHDLRSNFIADEQVAVSGDTWTVISYHVLDEASAAATIDAQYTRPEHAAQ